MKQMYISILGEMFFSKDWLPPEIPCTITTRGSRFLIPRIGPYVFFDSEISLCTLSPSVVQELFQVVRQIVKATHLVGWQGSICKKSGIVIMLKNASWNSLIKTKNIHTGWVFLNRQVTWQWTELICPAQSTYLATQQYACVVGLLFWTKYLRVDATTTSGSHDAVKMFNVSYSSRTLKCLFLKGFSDEENSPASKFPTLFPLPFKPPYELSTR